MKRTVSIMVVLCLFISGCATTHQLTLSEQGFDKLLLVSEMATDAYGRPVPGKRLKKRPTKFGKQYTTVLMRSGLPMRSFDIGVAAPTEADFSRTVEILGAYTFTGAMAGTVVGLLTTSGDSGEGHESMGDDEVQSKGDFVFASVVAGAALGLVVGIVMSVPEMVEQTNLLVLKSDENLLGYSEYEYDGLRRLCLVRNYISRGEYYRVVLTEYLYEGSSEVPASSKTSSDYVKKDESSGI